MFSALTIQVNRLVVKLMSVGAFVTDVKRNRQSPEPRVREVSLMVMTTTVYIAFPVLL